MRHWELSNEYYNHNSITEMKLLLRVLSSKSYEESTAAEQQQQQEGNKNNDQQQFKYSDFQKLTLDKEEFSELVVDTLNFWICEYVNKLRQWLGKETNEGEILDILLRNRR